MELVFEWNLQEKEIYIISITGLKGVQEKEIYKDLKPKVNDQAVKLLHTLHNYQVN